MAALVRNPCPRLWTRTLCGTSSTSSPQRLCGYPSRHGRTNIQLAMRCYRSCYSTSSTLCSRTRTTRIHMPAGHRSFHTTRTRRRSDDDLAKRNHYERLQVPPTATRGEIKKSFYKLSKAHHPDANRHDPNASHTFSLLSESYTLLSDPSRRSIYDRDVMRPFLQSQSSQPPHHHGTPQHGSYHSSSAAHSAGGRPPSGLSKRRGTFRGPPPSFYRSGGWGAQADKRKRAHEESTSYSSPSSASSSTSSSSRPNQEGGPNTHYTNYKGSHGDAFTQQQTPGGRFARDEDDVPLHFDKESHRRTHENEDKRRWARQRKRRALDDEDMEFEPQTSLGAHFAIMLGILGATVLVPVMYLGVLNGNKKKKEI